MVSFENSNSIRLRDSGTPRAATDIVYDASGKISALNVYYPTVQEGQNAEGVDFLEFQRTHPDARLQDVTLKVLEIAGNNSVQGIQINNLGLTASSAVLENTH